MRDKVRVAALQPHLPHEMGWRERFDKKFVPQFKQSVKSGAELLVTTEFAIGSSFITETVRDEEENVVEVGRKEGRAPLKEVEKMTKDAGVYCVFNAYSKDQNNYARNTSFLLGPEGLIGSYDKTHMFAWEHPLLNAIGKKAKKGSIWSKIRAKDGTRMQVFDTKVGKLCLEVCEDMMLPEVTRTYAMMGAEIACVSSRQPGPFLCPWADFAKVRSQENFIYIVAVGGAEDHSVATLVTSPRLKDPIVSMAGREEQVLVVDLDMKLLRSERKRNPKIFSITNPDERDTVVWPDLLHGKGMFDFGVALRDKHDGRPHMYLKHMVPLWFEALKKKNPEEYRETKKYLKKYLESLK